MNDTISERSKMILRLLANGDAMSRSKIEKMIGKSRITVIRELNSLIDRGLVKSSGEARATVYTITNDGRAVTIWDVEEYMTQEPDKRQAHYVHFEPSLLKAFDGATRIHPVLINATKRAEADSVTTQKELERFVIELSWKSSKIEGNTYTLLDTERLIREAREAPGHNHDEALMILNHRRAFDYIWQHQKDFRQLTVQQVEEVHRLLVDGLGIPYGLRKTGVGITGTVYLPPSSKAEIEPYLRDIIIFINRLDAPLDKALACLVLFSYLQPFTDGNKRMSRLITNAVLLAHGYQPLSYRSVDEQAYKGALILFYEQGTLANFRNLFLQQLEESATNYFLPARG